MSVYAYVFVRGTQCLGSPASFSSTRLEFSKYVQQTDGNNKHYKILKSTIPCSSSNYNFIQMTDSCVILIKLYATYNPPFDND